MSSGGKGGHKNIQFYISLTLCCFEISKTTDNLFTTSTIQTNRKYYHFVGCKVLFQREKLSDPITTIAESSQKYVYVPTSDKCRFFIWPTLGINQYLECNGQWKRMTSGDVWYPFHLISTSWSKRLSIRVCSCFHNVNVNC